MKKIGEENSLKISFFLLFKKQEKINKNNQYIKL
jgi:hypothetical protein